jgi:hypothetical protein
MSRFRLLVFAALFLACASTAAADGVVDPVIIVRGGSGSIVLTSTAPVPLIFPGNPGCISGSYAVPGPFFGLPWMECVFLNNTGGPITQLTFNINLPQLPLTLQCAILCSSFGSTTNGGVATFFFNPPIPTVLPNSEFAVDFINFTQGTSIIVTPNPVPEPGTMALLLTGLGTLALRRKRAKTA